MKIIDPRDFKIYEIENPQIAYHTMPNKDGNDESVKCVEYCIIGKNHSWDFWMSYDDFTKANPEVMEVRNGNIE